MSQEKYITKSFIISSIRAYNRALLFNRKRAKKLRAEAYKVLEEFVADNSDLEDYNLSDYMDAFIKTFSIIKKRKVSKIAMDAFNKLNRYSYSRCNLAKRQPISKLLTFESRLVRGISSLFGRYDLIDNEITSKQQHVPQTLGHSSPEDDNMQDNLFPNQPDSPIPHTDCLRPSQDPDYQAEMQRYQTSPAENSSQSCSRKRILRRRHNRTFFAVAGATLLGLGGWFQMARIGNAERQKEQETLARATLFGFEQSKLNIIAAHPDTISYNAPILPSGLEQKTTLTKSVAKSASALAITKSDTTKLQSNSVAKQVNDKHNKIAKTSINSANDSIAKIYKNYYDNTIALHLGEKGKTELYAKINKAIHQGKITLPAGETMEHLALVMTISQLVQPNSQNNKLLQQITSGNPLTIQQQQQVWQIVKAAGKTANNIKGSGHHSNYDNSSEQVKQSHNKVVQQLIDAGRIYRISINGK